MSIEGKFTAANFLHVCVFMLFIFSASTSPAREIYILEQGLYHAENCANQKQSLPALVMEDIRSRTSTGKILTADYQRHTVKSLQSMSSTDISIPAETDAWNIESLAAAVTEARRSAISGSEPDTVVIYLPHTHHPKINSLLKQLGDIQPATVELRLVDTGQPDAAISNIPVTGVQIGISRMACPVRQPPRQEINNDVIQQVADYLGIPANHIHNDTDLIRDLGIGRADIFDVIAYLCDLYEVPLPRDLDMNNIGEIVTYLVETPTGIQAETTDDPTRGRKKNTEEPPYLQTIYYATNREPESQGKGVFFSGERSKNGKVTYGVCEVRIPSSHKKGQLERPFLGIEALASSRNHIQIKRLVPLKYEDFFQEISGHEKVEQQEVAVFIHGYGTSFTKAAMRTAQFALDSEFEGVPMMFSWPSDGKFFNYLPDKEDALWSVTHIAEYIMDVRDRLPNSRLHLIAHSMGSMALLQALDMIALRKGVEINENPFFNVILAAPDFDAELFEQQVAPRTIALSENWTVYTSDQDLALDVSAEINSAKRLGTPVTPIAGIDVVDASGLEVTPWSVPEFHSYYATKQIVMNDIIQTLQGVPASVRGLVKRTLGALSYWQIGPAQSLR